MNSLPPRREDHTTSTETAPWLSVSYEEYHPFGTTSWHAHDSTITARKKRYRYTGKEKDEETGLCYHGARYYAPWLGRWCSADPAGMVDGPNRYAYVRNGPIGGRDPSGLGAEDSHLLQEPEGPSIRSLSSEERLLSRPLLPSEQAKLGGRIPTAQDAAGDQAALGRYRDKLRAAEQHAASKLEERNALVESITGQAISGLADLLISDAEAGQSTTSVDIVDLNLRHLASASPEALEVAQATVRAVNQLLAEGTPFVLRNVRGLQPELAAGFGESMTRAMMGSAVHRATAENLRGSSLVVWVGSGNEPADALGLRVNTAFGRPEGLEVTTATTSTALGHARRPEVDTLVVYDLHDTLVSRTTADLRRFTGVRSPQEYHMVRDAVRRGQMSTSLQRARQEARRRGR